MRTVLFVQGGAERAGAERVLLALLRSIDPERFHRVVAFMAEGPFIDEVVATGADVVRIPPAPRLRELHAVPRAVRSLRDAIASTGADLVQATGEKMSIYAGWAARGSGRPCIFWLHDAPGTRPGTLLAQAAMAMSPRSAVVTCSSWLATGFRRRGVPALAITNGIELDRLPGPGAAADARSRLLTRAGWPEHSVVLAHVARLQRWKGTDVFLRAGARVLERHPHARLLVVGGPLFGRERPFAEALPRLAADLGLDDRVQFTGHRPDALELMAAADAVVHCSVRPDPFPTVVLETMALGRPVIATRTRGPEEAVVHDHTGLLVPPGDERALAAAMDRVVSSEPLARRMAAAAARDARRRFAAPVMAGAFEELWERLSGTRAAA